MIFLDFLSSSLRFRLCRFIAIVLYLPRVGFQFSCILAAVIMYTRRGNLLMRRRMGGCYYVILVILVTETKFKSVQIQSANGSGTKRSHRDRYTVNVKFGLPTLSVISRSSSGN
jgi:hypothetical protein